ncbi:MAG: hypothetical protein ABIJ14_03235 [Nanoarchaeota archaeon]|nr:hypothetical protein [Nanoarchaeota archaeon]
MNPYGAISKCEEAITYRGLMFEAIREKNDEGFDIINSEYESKCKLNSQNCLINIERPKLEKL